jgi:Ca2+-binding EF-hand superfamily protein
MVTKEQLLEDFKKFDFNSDGFICAEELLAILSRDGGHWDLKTAEFMLKEVSKKADTNKDGQVSVEELAAAFADEKKV